MSNFVGTSPQVFSDFSLISNLFSNIHESANHMIYLSNKWVKVLC